MPIIGIPQHVLKSLSYDLVMALVLNPTGQLLPADVSLQLRRELDALEAPSTYVEATDANPERVNNGCMIFRAGQ